MQILWIIIFIIRFWDVVKQQLKIKQESAIKNFQQKYILKKDLIPKKYCIDKMNFQFKKIHNAYEVLSDPEKRKYYDIYGIKKQQEFEDSANLFKKMLDGFQKSTLKSSAIKRFFSISLEECYNGKIINLMFTRIRCCKVCNGSGNKEKKYCQKKKIQVKIQQIAPGSSSLAQQFIHGYSNNNNSFKQELKCNSCKGNLLVQQQKAVQLVIDRGVTDNYSIMFPGQGNHFSNQLAGDLIAKIQVEKHHFFDRIDKQNLRIKKQIALIEALIGTQFILKHLDGKEYIISTEKCQGFKNNGKKVVEGLGMPYFKNQNLLFGDLMIQFEIRMPSKGDFTVQQLKLLEQILPAGLNKVEKIHKDEYQIRLVEQIASQSIKNDINSDKQQKISQEKINCQNQ